MCVLAAMLAVGCEADTGPPKLPAEPLAYSTSEVILPDCEIPRVQIRDWKTCPPDEIGRTIRTVDVCRSLIALRDWMAAMPLEAPSMESGDWSRIRAVSVCRMPEPLPVATNPQTARRTFRLLLEADVPERPRLFFVSMSEETGAMQFGVNHR